MSSIKFVMPSIKIGVVAESATNECRVGITPEVVKNLSVQGYSFIISKGAGAKANFTDQAYQETGNNISIAPQNKVIDSSDILVSVHPLNTVDIEKMKKNAIHIGQIFAHKNTGCITAYNKKNIAAIALELLPRITRAQPMDVLSTQATVAGYQAVLRAADLSAVFFPMLTYAAGTIRPAKVLVIGTGVAGLQAIATAKRLGAVVQAYDIRSETREQVESLGAKFVDININAAGEGGYARKLTKAEIQQQQDVLARHVAAANVVICTAAVPGSPAPLIITKEMVGAMQLGSVIIDLAAEHGGNCAVTVANKTIQSKNGVIVAGPVNIQGQLAQHASDMFAKNVAQLLGLLGNGNAVDWPTDDEVLLGATLTRNGATVHPQFITTAATPPSATSNKTTTTKTARKTAATKATSTATKTTKKTTTTASKATPSTTTKPVKKAAAISAATQPAAETSAKTTVANLKNTADSSVRRKIDGKDEVLTGSASQWLKGHAE